MFEDTEDVMLDEVCGGGLEMKVAPSLTLVSPNRNREPGQLRQRGSSHARDRRLSGGETQRHPTGG